MSLGRSPRRLATAGLLGAAGMIAVVTLLSRIIGFGRWIAQANTLGPTETGTVYATANLIPNVLFEVVAGGALAGAVVPLLAAPIAAKIREDVNRTSSALLTWALSALLPLTIILIISARPLVQLLGITDEGGIELGVTLLRIFAWQIPLYGLSIVFTGILQAQKRFFWPAFAPLLNSLVVIASYLVFSSISTGNLDSPGLLSTPEIMWLGWGTTAGVFAMSVPLIIPVLRTGVRLRPTWRFPEGVARRALRLTMAGVGTLLAQQGATLAIIYSSNNFGTGGTLNIYQYTQAVYFLPYAILAVPLATSSFPRLAERAAISDHAGYADLVAAITRGVAAIGILGASLLVAVAPAVQILFGVVTSQTGGSIEGMSLTLTAMAPGLLGYALVFSLSRALYARENGRAAVLATSAGWVVVAIVSLAGSFLASRGGRNSEGTLLSLGLGNSIGMTVAAFALCWAIRRIAGSAALSGVARTLVVGTAGGLLGAILGRFVTDLLTTVGNPVGGALLGGIGGALACTVVLLATMWFADPGAMRTLLHLNSKERADGGDHD